MQSCTTCKTAIMHNMHVTTMHNMQDCMWQQAQRRLSQPRSARGERERNKQKKKGEAPGGERQARGALPRRGLGQQKQQANNRTEHTQRRLTLTQNVQGCARSRRVAAQGAVLPRSNRRMVKVGPRSRFSQREEKAPKKTNSVRKSLAGSRGFVSVTWTLPPVEWDTVRDACISTGPPLVIRQRDHSSRRHEWLCRPRGVNRNAGGRTRSFQGVQLTLRQGWPARVLGGCSKASKKENIKETTQRHIRILGGV